MYSIMIIHEWWTTIQCGGAKRTIVRGLWDVYVNRGIECHYKVVFHGLLHGGMLFGGQTICYQLLCVLKPIIMTTITKTDIHNHVIWVEIYVNHIPTWWGIRACHMIRNGLQQKQLKNVLCSKIPKELPVIWYRHATIRYTCNHGCLLLSKMEKDIGVLK